MAETSSRKGKRGGYGRSSENPVGKVETKGKTEESIKPDQKLQPPKGRWSGVLGPWPNTAGKRKGRRSRARRKEKKSVKEKTQRVTTPDRARRGIPAKRYVKNCPWTVRAFAR